MHVLIVDDDPLAGDLAAAVLADAGHDCQVAQGAAEALVQLEADARIALVVSDQQMPGMSGLELFRALRARGCGLPFVLLSGDAPASLRALEPGLAGVLAKDAALEETLPALVSSLAPVRG